MTISAADFWLYALALLGLFLTPGPVWVGLLARALSGGFRAAWPLAVGVAVGDVLWPLLAILGMGWIVSEVSGALTVLKWVAAVTFVVMGTLVIRHAGTPVTTDGRLTRPGTMAGFLAGCAVILGNPKAVLFYGAFLPGFFDVGSLTWWDVVAICGVSVAVPMVGNLTMAAFIDRSRVFLRSPAALARASVVAGSLLIAVGVAIPFL